MSSPSLVPGSFSSMHGGGATLTRSSSGSGRTARDQTAVWTESALTRRKQNENVEARWCPQTGEMLGPLSGAPPLGRCVLPRHIGRTPSGQDCEADIDTSATQAPLGRGKIPGSQPTWLVLAAAGQPVMGDASTGVETVSIGSTFVR